MEDKECGNCPYVDVTFENLINKQYNGEWG